MKKKSKKIRFVATNKRENIWNTWRKMKFYRKKTKEKKCYWANSFITGFFFGGFSGRIDHRWCSIWLCLFLEWTKREIRNDAIVLFDLREGRNAVLTLQALALDLIMRKYFAADDTKHRSTHKNIMKRKPPSEKINCRWAVSDQCTHPIHGS